MTPDPITTAKLHMAGNSTAEIAKTLQTTPKTVSAVLKAKPTRALLKEMKDRLINEGLPKATEVVINTIHAYSDALETDDLGRPTQEGLQRRDHGMKASLRLLEATGLLPSPQAPILVTNIDKSTTIVPMINIMLAKEMASVTPPEAQNVEQVVNIEPVIDIPRMESEVNPFE